MSFNYFNRCCFIKFLEYTIKKGWDEYIKILSLFDHNQ